MLQTTTPSAVASDTADAAPALDLRDQLRMLMESDKRLSQARVAKEADMSPTTLSQWLSGIYAGNNDAVEEKLLKWVETTQAARAQADVMPTGPDYVPTPSAEKVIAALRYAQIANDIAVVYGGAGLGKTTGIKQYRRAAPNVWHATMTPASASVVPALEEIAEAVGVSNAVGGASKLHRAICRRIANAGGLLVIDEAQHLSVAALDQIRSIHDETNVGIALVGNEQVYARMTGGNRAAYLDRLFSRIGKKVRLIKSSQADIETILDAWGIDDAKCRPQLIELECVVTNDGSQRYQNYIVKGQRAGSDTASGASVSAMKATAKDPGVPRARTLVILADDETDLVGLKKRAEWEATVRAGRALTVPVAVRGWSHPGGLWRVNRIVPVYSPTLRIERDLLIRDAEYSLDRGGELTRMTLTPIEAYTPEIAPAAKKAPRRKRSRDTDAVDIFSP